MAAQVPATTTTRRGFGTSCFMKATGRDGNNRRAQSTMAEGTLYPELGTPCFMKCIGEVARMGRIITFHLSKL